MLPLMEFITTEDTCFVVGVLACIALIFNTTLLSLYFFKSKSKSKSESMSKCLPRPPTVPVISTVSWLLKSTLDMERTFLSLCSKYGPIVSVKVGSHDIVAVSGHSLAYQALVRNGAIFSDRPKPFLTAKILSSNKHNINSACYGPTWRLLRRNLTAQTLHPSKSKDFSQARKWALDMLIDRMEESAVAQVGFVGAINQFRNSMFSMLVFMCFGEKLHASQINEIEALQRRSLSSFTRFFILDFCWVSVTKILFSRLWNELYDLKKKREELLLPHIIARKKMQEQGMTDEYGRLEQAKPISENAQLVTCYVDSLLKLELLEEGGNTKTKRKLSEEELVNLSSEFLSAGTDTTATALQWIMANLVKYPHIQAKLFEEIKAVVREQSPEVGEDELSKVPYLKAVVLETLRRHPPTHFTVPHAVTTQEVELGGYAVPKDAIINFMIGAMGLDPAVWENPMQFKPERFLTNMGTVEFDITGSREIKMMPFGVGRRMCPGLGLAMLHLEYFVANLVWKFEWKAIEGHEVDLSEKQDFSIVMKHPFHAHISPRHTK